MNTQGSSRLNIYHQNSTELNCAQLADSKLLRLLNISVFKI